jgi:hypothetical protein
MSELVVASREPCSYRRSLADALNRTGDGDDEIAHVRVPGVNAVGRTYRLSGVRKAGINSGAGEPSRDAAK